MANMEILAPARQVMLDIIHRALDAGKQVSFQRSEMDSLYGIVVDAPDEVYLSGYAQDAYSFGTRLDDLNFIDLAHLAQSASSKL